MTGQADTLALPRVVLITSGLVLLGAVGGWIGSVIGIPMPWMLGSLMATALLVTRGRTPIPGAYSFPLQFRTFFITLIGVMIGAQVDSGMVGLARQLPLTLGALALFVLACQFGNMILFQRLGAYDRATAFFAGSPGGLMESILLGEAAGADQKLVSAQQFLRIILVISILPLGLSLWLGQPVGSAAGLTPPGGAPEVPPLALLLIPVTGLGGLWLGRALRLPTPQLIGPMVLTALASLLGLITLNPPAWMIIAAQIVIGSSLGLRFRGMDGRLLRRSALLSLVSVSYMLGLGLVCALGLQAATGLGFLPLLLSFAPGGVTEMSVIALGLSISPALISLHHVVRIFLTVLEMSLIARWLGLR